jgi:hypothetical protein
MGGSIVQAKYCAVCVVNSTSGIPMANRVSGATIGERIPLKNGLKSVEGGVVAIAGSIDARVARSPSAGGASSQNGL